MPYIGSAPAATALTSADIADGAVTTAKINDDAVTTAKINNDSVTLAKMASGTDGNIITYDASGDPAAVSTGSSGQLLTSAGAGAPPTFTTVAQGGMTHIATTEASGTSVEFTGLNSSEYNYYRCMIEDSGSNSNPSYMRFYLGNDSGYYTGGWSYYSFGQYALTDIRQNVNQDYFETENQGYASGGDKYWWWDFTGTKSGEMPDHSMVVYHQYMNGNNSGNAANNQTTQTGHGILAESSLAFTKCKWVSSSGNYTGTKKWRLFGVK